MSDLVEMIVGGIFEPADRSVLAAIVGALGSGEARGFFQVSIEPIDD
jgi:hypothetical protein